MVELYPPAKWMPISCNFNTTGFSVRPVGMIPHVQVGNGSLFDEFNNPKKEASAHLWLSKTGSWEQYVKLTEKAWAQGAGNAHWVSIECEGFPNEDYTLAQMGQLGKFFVWGAQQWGWPYRVTDDPIYGKGIGTHVMGGTAWGGHTCPGPGPRASRRTDILNLARAINAAPLGGTVVADLTPEQIAKAVWEYGPPQGMTPAVTPPIPPGGMHSVVGHIYNIHHRLDGFEATLAKITEKLGITE